MPEIPDLTVYVDALEARLKGQELRQVLFVSPFVLRTVVPAKEDLLGRRVVTVSRMAKQLVFELEGEYFIIIHLMISGRFQWSQTFKPPPKRNGLAAFEFTGGTLLLTEASKKKRASVRLIQGRENMQLLDPGGLEVLSCSLAEFAARLKTANHTLKRALTDQRIFAGIGNAYSDEILLYAQLSPFKHAAKLNTAEVERLYRTCQQVLQDWIERLRNKSGDKFPTKVTAFHAEMAAHGKYKQPCPVCAAPIQRIVYAENEANYCARCQTDGRLLADRSLSKLLKSSWPKRIEELEG